MLTKREVKRRATTRESAIDVSKQHWDEIATATDEELAKAPDDLVGSEYCGLCVYYKKNTEARHCNHCPYSCVIGTTWHVAYVAFKQNFWDKLRASAIKIVTQLGEIPAVHYDPEIRRCGFTSVVASVPSDWTDDQVIEFVKEEAWGRSGWEVRDPGSRLKCFQRQGFERVIIDFSLEERGQDEVVATKEDNKG